MKPFRLKISRVMIVVALPALELGAIRALQSALRDDFLIQILPMANVMLLAGYLAIRKPHARGFVAGFIAASLLTLFALEAWTHSNPWTFLRHVEPPFQALDRRIPRWWPIDRDFTLGSVASIAFMVPHAILGLAGGCLTGMGWALVKRLKAA